LKYTTGVERLGTSEMGGVIATNFKLVQTRSDDPSQPSAVVLVSVWQQQKAVARSRRDEPGAGSFEARTVEFSTIEPDPKLFVPPPDYTLVDAPLDFTIEIRRPPGAIE
jgi:hypothetical protein